MADGKKEVNIEKRTKELFLSGMEAVSGSENSQARDLTLARVVWQGMAMDSLRYHYGPPCLTLRVGLPAGRAACSCLLPHAVRLWRGQRGAYGLCQELFVSLFTVEGRPLIVIGNLVKMCN
jgi:hypothetical protein